MSAAMQAPSPAAHQRTPSSSRRILSSYASPTSTRPQPTSSQSYSRRSTEQPSGRPLGEILPAKDVETTNLPKTTSSSRRSSSQGRSYPNQAATSNAAPQPSRSQSYRGNPPPATAASSGVAKDPASRQTNGNQMPSRPGALSDDRRMPTGGVKQRRTEINASSGVWILGKTIGSGSMGKVKLAKKTDGSEQCAVKIVPRQSTEDLSHSRSNKEDKDHSKEIRTAREAAIVTLLKHPYVCSMRDVVRTNHHWYMLFEYVNGGQMLDYIISHGRLKEKQARKFTRQIASSLDYSHRNSIVHRDLKIENILISKTGDIKIIDFGLSNLYSPSTVLKTFCGSLYFAAPELLQAQKYTGPEVDIWSFGIVLYVLVCGKVPFDDQHMSVLHAKIKKGIVDYPQWLSAECKHLISRMLVTDPRLRATLQEIIAHPWMTKGFPGPVENYLPPREPLTLPLDRNVILAMTGFDFGSPDSIERNLTEVLEREEYKNAVKAYYRERAGHGLGNDRRKMFGAFDFYKRRSSVSGKEQVSGQTGETMPLGQDPTNAFHPLISIYYLVREKQERDALEELPGALEIPHSPDEAPIPLPDLPAPPPVHTNTSTYEMPGEAPTGGRSRARARTHGEDEMDEVTNKGYAPGGSPMPPASPNIEAQPAKKENAAVGLLRRFSTRKSRDPDRERHGRPTAPSVTVQTTERSRSRVDQGPSKSLSIRRTRDRTNPPVSRQWPIDASPVRGDLLSPQDAATGGLHRSSSINDAESRRQQVSRATSEGPPSATLPLTSSSDRAMVTDQQELGTSTPPVTGTQRRHTKSYSTTIRTKSLGHARRESIQARRAQMVEARNADAAPEDAAAQQDEPHGEGRELAAEQAKPVYLKGLFSVQTTSTKPVSVIRVDIIRVLNQLSIPYLEMRGGFSCQQRPSIRLPLEPSSASAELIPPKAGSHRRKISFGGLKGAASNSNSNGKDAEKAEDLLDLQRSPKPSFFGSVAVPAGRRPQDNSFTGSDNSNESIDRKMTANNPTTTTTKKHQQQQQQPADGIQGRAAPGEETMTLNFEINIVKVPLLSLHGIQFKRVGGDTWTYKEMASKILRELRL